MSTVVVPIPNADWVVVVINNRNEASVDQFVVRVVLIRDCLLIGSFGL